MFVPLRFIYGPSLLQYPKWFKLLFDGFSFQGPFYVNMDFYQEGPPQKDIGNES